MAKDVGVNSRVRPVGRTADWVHPVSLQITQRAPRNSHTAMPPPKAAFQKKGAAEATLTSLILPI